MKFIVMLCGDSLISRYQRALGVMYPNKMASIVLLDRKIRPGEMIRILPPGWINLRGVEI